MELFIPRDGQYLLPEDFSPKAIKDDWPSQGMNNFMYGRLERREYLLYYYIII